MGTPTYGGDLHARITQLESELVTYRILVSAERQKCDELAAHAQRYRQERDDTRKLLDEVVRERDIAQKDCRRFQLEMERRGAEAIFDEKQIEALQQRVKFLEGAKEASDRAYCVKDDELEVVCRQRARLHEELAMANKKLEAWEHGRITSPLSPEMIEARRLVDYWRTRCHVMRQERYSAKETNKAIKAELERRPADDVAVERIHYLEEINKQLSASVTKLRDARNWWIREHASACKDSETLKEQLRQVDSLIERLGGAIRPATNIFETMNVCCRLIDLRFRAKS